MRRISGNKEMLPVQTAYDQWADEYDDADPTTALDEPFVILHAQTIWWVSDSGSGLRQGAIHPSTRWPNVQLVGLDLSHAMLVRAKRTTTLSSVTLVQASIGQLPFALNSFDRVIECLVLDHIHDLSAFFQETAAVLRPGGRLLVSAVHPDMQHLTGSAVRFTVRRRVCYTWNHPYGQCYYSGRTRCRSHPESLQEPRIDHALITRYPAWSVREGCSALVLFAARKSLPISR